MEVQSSYGGKEVASITIRRLEDSVKAKLKIRAAENGRSMEEEVRHILRLAANYEQLESEEEFKRRISKMSLEERLIELEKRGVIVRAKDPDTRLTVGEPAPGALEQFLADR